MLLKRAIVIAAVAAACAAGRTSLAVFPLQNASRDGFSDWMRYAIPELLSRSLCCYPGLQVWDPVFLFRVDSTGSSMDSDSLLRLHHQRWQWDAAVGGVYKVHKDSVAFQLRVFRYLDGEEVKKTLAVGGAERQTPTVIANVMMQLLSVLGQAPRPDEARQLEESIIRDMRAVKGYATYAAGYGFEMHGLIEEALSAYARAAELMPTAAPPQCRMGMIYRTAGRVASARACFGRALNLAPRSPFIVAEGVDFALDHEPPDKSVKMADGKREILEASAAGLRVMGKAYVVKGEFQRAVAMFTRSMAFGPADLETDFSLGTTYFAMGQFGLASDIFNKLVQVRPDHLRYYSSLGAAYRNAGRLMESVQVLESGARIDPADATVLLNLANTYFDLGWYDRARQLLGRAHEANTELTGVDLNLAAVLWFSGEKEAAQKVYQAVQRAPRSQQIIYNNLGNIYYLDGLYRKALKAYQRAEKSGRTNETVLYNLARTCAVLGKTEEAVRYLEQVLSVSPSRLDVLETLSGLAERRGDYSKAEIYYGRTLDVSPGNEDALAGLTRVLCRQGRCKEGIDYAEAFLDRLPNSKKVRTILGDTYNSIEWYEVAATKFEELLRDFPGDPDALMGLGRSLYGIVLKKEGKQADKAIGILLKARDATGQSVESDRMLGEIYLCVNERGKAADYLSQALARTSDRRDRQRIEGLLAQAKGRKR